MNINTNKFSTNSIDIYIYNRGGEGLCLTDKGRAKFLLNIMITIRQKGRFALCPCIANLIQRV
jgi:hypothetical protein